MVLGYVLPLPTFFLNSMLLEARGTFACNPYNKETGFVFICLCACLYRRISPIAEPIRFSILGEGTTAPLKEITKKIERKKIKYSFKVPLEASRVVASS